MLSTMFPRANISPICLSMRGYSSHTNYKQEKSFLSDNTQKFLKGR